MYLCGMEKINTLTDFQKDFFNFVITEHKRRKKSEPTISQQVNLVDWIVKDYQINYTMISVHTGKVLTGDKKHSVMCVENMGYMEDILDW
jgi:hypothetical protein